MKRIHNIILDNFREITLYNMDEGTDDDSPQSEPVFLSCYDIISFFKPYSIGLSPWCHGYDYEYYTTTTQITAGAFKLAGVQYISELHSSRSFGAGNTNTIKSMSTRLFTPGLGWCCQPRRCGTYGKTQKLPDLTSNPML